MSNNFDPYRRPRTPILSDAFGRPPIMRGRPIHLPDGRDSLLVGAVEGGATTSSAEFAASQGESAGSAAALWSSPGLSLDGCLAFLRARGLSTHAEQGLSLEDPVQNFELGLVVILLVNAGELWNSADWRGNGDGNHLVVLAGLAFAPETGELQGWYVMDPLGAAETTAFVDVERASRAWLECGGAMILCEGPRK